MPEFNGQWAELCRGYVEFKRGMGYKYDERTCRNIEHLCDYLNQNVGDGIALTQETVEGYTKRRESEAAATQKLRVNYIRQFGLYIQTMGYKAYLPPFCYVKVEKTFVPYIYSKEEIRRILKAADNMPYRYANSDSRLVYPLLIRMLAFCGLRVSEALALKVYEVDVENGVLYINKSKGDVCRNVPMSKRLCRKCVNYLASVKRCKTPESYLFETISGKKYVKDNIYAFFRKILRQADIEHNGRGSGPRLHDLRHTYAVYALNSMVKQNIDIYTALPVISTYMGHRTIESTEKYVRLVPAFHQDILDSLTKFSPDIFPEVAQNE